MRAIIALCVVGSSLALLARRPTCRRVHAAPAPAWPGGWGSSPTARRRGVGLGGRLLLFGVDGTDTGDRGGGGGGGGSGGAGGAVAGPRESKRLMKLNREIMNAGRRGNFSRAMEVNGHSPVLSRAHARRLPDCHLVLAVFPHDHWRTALYPTTPTASTHAQARPQPHLNPNRQPPLASLEPNCQPPTA